MTSLFSTTGSLRPLWPHQELAIERASPVAARRQETAADPGADRLRKDADGGASHPGRARQGQSRHLHRAGALPDRADRRRLP